MRSAGPARQRAVADVINELHLEFDDAVPVLAIREVVATAAVQLGTDVPAGAFSEFLHRLARYRLLELQAGTTERAEYANAIDILTSGPPG